MGTPPPGYFTTKVFETLSLGLDFCWRQIWFGWIYFGYFYFTRVDGVDAPSCMRTGDWQKSIPQGLKPATLEQCKQGAMQARSNAGREQRKQGATGAGATGGR